MVPKAKQTPVISIQEIYIQEKGQDSMRALNISIIHDQRKDEPNHEKKAAHGAK